MVLHSLNRNELLDLSLKMSGRVADGGTPTNDQYSKAAEIINMVHSDLMNNGQPLIQIELKSKTVSSSSFALDTEDEDILLMYTSDANSDNPPMRRLSYDDYHGGILDKTDTGEPYSYYVDFQSTRTVYLYPVPTSETIKYLVIKRFDKLSSNDDIPLDNRYYLYLMYEVAHHLCNLYQVDVNRSIWLQRMASKYEKKVKSKDKSRYPNFKRGLY